MWQQVTYILQWLAEAQSTDQLKLHTDDAASTHQKQKAA